MKLREAKEDLDIPAYKKNGFEKYLFGGSGKISCEGGIL